MSASTQPRVKKKRINWSKGEHAVKMTKALTYYELKKDEFGKTLTKTQLIKEAAKAYGVPEKCIRRRVNDFLLTNKGQGVVTAITKDQKGITETNVVEKWN